MQKEFDKDKELILTKSSLILKTIKLFWFFENIRTLMVDRFPLVNHNSSSGRLLLWISWSIRTLPAWLIPLYSINFNFILLFVINNHCSPMIDAWMFIFGVKKSYCFPLFLKWINIYLSYLYLKVIDRINQI